MHHLAKFLSRVLKAFLLCSTTAEPEPEPEEEPEEEIDMSGGDMFGGDDY